MEITKITEKYKLTQEGVDYILDLGTIKRGEDTTTELLISDLDDSNLLEVRKTCGCTTTDKKIIDEHTQSVKITYTDCVSAISKVLEIKYKGVKIGLIKIKGTCR